MDVVEVFGIVGIGGGLGGLPGKGEGGGLDDGQDNQEDHEGLGPGSFVEVGDGVLERLSVTDPGLVNLEHKILQVILNYAKDPVVAARSFGYRLRMTA